MSKLSKDTKQRIVISLTSESAGKELIDAIESAATGSGDEYALKDLSNIAGTAIPAGVNLESSNTSQVTTTAFALRTKDQLTSNSGRIQVRTGITDGSFTSGGINIESGTVTNANGASLNTLVTGSTLITSGAISGGIKGSSGSSFVRSGSVVVSSATSYSGNSGTVGVSSGPIAALVTGATVTGTTGFANLITGSVSSQAASATANASSGNILVSTGGISTTTEGAIVNGNTGSATFSSGAVSGGFITSGTSNSNTGSVNFNSGNITNTNNTGNTGSVNIFSGSNSGTGITGNVNITTGQRAGNLPRGSIFLDGQGVNINLRNYDVTGDHSLFNISNQSPGGTGGIQFLTYAKGNNTMGMRIFESDPSSGFSIQGYGILNQNGGAFNFESTGASANIDGTLNGGDFNILAGSVGYIDPALGLNASVNSGSVNINTADGYITGSNTDANSGNINLTTGQKTGSGIRGNITMNSKETTIVSDFVKLQNYTRLVLEDNFGDQLVRLQLTSSTAEGYGQFFFNRIRSDKEVFIGAMESHVDDDGAPVVFSGTFSLSDTDGQYKTSDVSLQTLSNSGFRDAPNVAVSSGNINIRTHNSFVQGTETDANTGNITLQTGTPSGAGTRGDVVVDARSIIMQATSGTVQAKQDFLVVNNSGLNYSHISNSDPNFSFAYIGGYDSPSHSSSIGGWNSIGQSGGNTFFHGSFVRGTVDGTFKASDVYLEARTAAGGAENTADNLEISSGDITVRSLNGFIKGTGANANSGNITLQTGTPQGAGTRGSVNINASKLDLQNTKVVNSSEFYFGDPNTDGTWRIRPDGGNLISEVRQGGVWVVRQTISPV